MSPRLSMTQGHHGSLSAAWPWESRSLSQSHPHPQSGPDKVCPYPTGVSIACTSSSSSSNWPAEAAAVQLASRSFWSQAHSSSAPAGLTKTSRTRSLQKGSSYRRPLLQNWERLLFSQFIETVKMKGQRSMLQMKEQGAEKTITPEKRIK